MPSLITTRETEQVASTTRSKHTQFEHSLMSKSIQPTLIPYHSTVTVPQTFVTSSAKKPHGGSDIEHTSDAPQLPVEIYQTLSSSTHSVHANTGKQQKAGETSNPNQSVNIHVSRSFALYVCTTGSDCVLSFNKLINSCFIDNFYSTFKWF